MPRATFLRVVCSCSALVVLVATHTQLRAQSPPGMIPAIQANSNRVPAGKLENGILTLRLELRQGDWYPEADTGTSMKVYAFAEEDKAPQIPGPLIRIPEGTEIHVTLHNLLPATAVSARLASAPGRCERRSWKFLLTKRETSDSPLVQPARINTMRAPVGSWATPVVRFEKTVSLQGRSWSIHRGK